MNPGAWNPALLVPVGKSLLLAAFAFCLIQGMRGRMELSLGFERLAIGFLAMTFYRDGAFWLEILSEQLSGRISSLGQGDLRQFLLEAFKKAAEAPAPSGQGSSFNLPALLEQAWRTGVWGVMSALVEGIFLIVSFVLECARDVLWALLLFLFPLACGAYPVFPRILGNLVLHAVELSFWIPMLCLVERVTGGVAREHLLKTESWGLSLVAVQVVAILLILLIPTVTHRFLSGAFSGDFNSQSGIFVLVQRVASAARGTPPVPSKGGQG